MQKKTLSKATCGRIPYVNTSPTKSCSYVLLTSDILVKMTVCGLNFDLSHACVFLSTLYQLLHFKVQ